MHSESKELSLRRALIRFLRSEEGGRVSAPLSGVRSQLELGEFQTSCVVESATGISHFALGEEVLVDIRVMHPQMLGAAFAQLEKVELYEGSRLVASGKFVRGGA